MSCKHNRKGSKQVPQCVEHIVHTICINHICIYRHSPFCHVPAGALRKKELRQILFEQAVDTIFTVDQVENKISSRSKALLQASSCLGNHQASLFLAIIHLSGLRQEVDQEQVHLTCFVCFFFCMYAFYIKHLCALYVSGSCLQFDWCSRWQPLCPHACRVQARTWN